MIISWLDFLICFFFGLFGIHKFRENKPGMGILYLFTFGLFMIGWLYDSIQYFIAAIKGERVKALPKYLKPNESLPVIFNSNVILQQRELCYYCDAVVFLNVENRIVSYSGSSRGIGVQIIGGLSYHTRKSKFTPVYADVQEKTSGVLSITNRRIIFSSSKVSFDKKISSLTALTPVKHGLLFQFESQPYLVLTRDTKYICQILSRISNPIS